MKTRARRWTSLAACSILCGGLSLVGAGVTAGSAGAAGPALTATPTSVGFGEVTLGDIEGPQSFTLTNTSATTDTIPANGISLTGPAADDFYGVAEDNCVTDASGTITLAAAASCTIDMYFVPGALGGRTATLDINDTQSSGVTVGLNGTGATGYYQVSSKGVVAHYGTAGFYGDLSGVTLNKPIVDIAQTGDDGGYWLAAADGGVFPFGDAQFYGSAGSLKLNKPIVGMAPTYDYNGYWLVASDGGIFTYGDAQFWGSTGGLTLNEPIVGMAATADGNGYWLVASDGGIFAFGDAPFFGSAGGWDLNQPVVGMAATPDGGGYWLVGSDGGIFAFGDAQFYGSTGSLHLAKPIVGVAGMPDGNGYWLSAADGGLFNYGSAPFLGAASSQGIGTVVAMTAAGASTLQAINDVPAVRPRAKAAVPLFRPLPAGARHFAGP